MTVSALKKKRRLAMSVARDAKKRMLESDLTPAASEEGERQGEVGEHNSAVAVPTTIQQTWLQHGDSPLENSFSSQLAALPSHNSECLIQQSDTPRLSHNKVNQCDSAAPPPSEQSHNTAKQSSLE